LKNNGKASWAISGPTINDINLVAKLFRQLAFFKIDDDCLEVIDAAMKASLSNSKILDLLKTVIKLAGPLARKRYWDLRENGIERKNFGLARMRYIALLGNIGHFRRRLR
jgi:ssDNA-specific exonuclease RecJ